MRRALIALLMLSGIATLPAGAVDKATFKCEDKASAAVNKWGGSRGKCIVKCQKAFLKGDPRTCSNPPGFDATTLQCVAAIDAKYTASVAKACPTGMPSCGSYMSQTAAAYAAAQIAAQASLVDGVTVPLLICDATRFKCESKVVTTLSKLSGGLGKCFGKCYAALQLKLDATRQCVPDMTGDPFDTLDATTRDCVNGAIATASNTITTACADAPTCGPLYGAGFAAVLNLVTGNLATSYGTPATSPYCAP